MNQTCFLHFQDRLRPLADFQFTDWVCFIGATGKETAQRHVSKKLRQSAMDQAVTVLLLFQPVKACRLTRTIVKHHGSI